MFAMIQKLKGVTLIMLLNVVKHFNDMVYNYGEGKGKTVQYHE